MASGGVVFTMIQKWAVRFFWVLLFVQIGKYAWLAEDAFINFRVIDQWLSGDGLVWNAGERVQVFTSPLWLFLTAFFTWVSGSVIYATLLVSVAFVFVFFGVLASLCAGRPFLFLLLGMTCAWSPAMRDYFTSGLETPLLMTAIAAFAACVVRGTSVSWRRLCFVASLCVLVRHDAALLVTPFLIKRLTQELKRGLDGSTWVRILGDGMAASLPFWAWTVFSIAYFGSPFPNTAGAKMVDGFDGPIQAMHYFQYMPHFDPVAYPLILMAILVNFAARAQEAKPLLAALAMFAIYLCHVGADYMAGRFLVGPMALAVPLLAHGLQRALDVAPLTWPTWAKNCVLTTAVAAFATQIAAVPNVSVFKAPNMPFVHGIADERHHYRGATDLMTLLVSGPQHAYMGFAKEIVQAPAHDVYLSCNVGMLGYYAPRSAYIVDPFALGDRFLAAMPLSGAPVRIGHFERAVPTQYVESLMVGANVIADPALHRYFDDVQLVVRGELFTWARWRGIWRLNSGAYRQVIGMAAVSRSGGALRMGPIAPPTGEAPKSCLGSGGGVMVPQQREGHLQLVFLRDAERAPSLAPDSPR